MTLDKILILDDKAPGEDFSTSQLLSNLTVLDRKLVDYYENTESLWKEINNGDDILLLKDFEQYSYIFIHHSFENSLVHDGLIGELIDKLSTTSNIIFFSGGRSESETPVVYKQDISKQTSCYEILRRQYFINFKNFLDSYILLGHYQIKFLYNPYISPKKDKAYRLLEVIKNDLEESIQSAIESNSFNELLSLYGYKNSSEISNRFSKMTDDAFVENLEDFIENN